MASFDRSQLNRRDWPLFQNGPVTMYWNKDILREDCSWLSAHDYRICTVESSEWKDQVDALAGLNEVLGLGEALGLADFCPTNLDGFRDALSDIDVPNEGGVAIVLLSYDKFTESNRKVAEAILDIMADRSRVFMLFGQRLAVIVQSDDPRLRFHRLGATAAGWNRREWLNERRGL